MDFTFHPGKNGTDPWVEFYPYTPSRAAGYAFMALFGISTIVHFVLMLPYRAAYFIPLILGGVCKCPLMITQLSRSDQTPDSAQAKRSVTTAAHGPMKTGRKSVPGPCRRY